MNYNSYYLIEYICTVFKFQNALAGTLNEIIVAYSESGIER